MSLERDARKISNTTWLVHIVPCYKSTENCQGMIMDSRHSREGGEGSTIQRLFIGKDFKACFMQFFHEVIENKYVVIGMNAICWNAARS